MRFPSKETFREAVGRLGLPASDEELDTLWSMVRDLAEQVDALRGVLRGTPGQDVLSEAVCGRSRGQRPPNS